MSKIQNPVVLIHKRENSDTYAVAITSGSQDYHDAVLMATMEPDMTGDDVDTWSKTGYYMAAEIERMRKAASLAIARLDSADDSTVWQAVGFAMTALECACSIALTPAGDAGAPQNCRSNKKVQVQDRQSVDHVDGESRCSIKAASALDSLPKIAESRCGMNSTLVNDSTTGKPLTITLPDISSKAFWSGTGKHEVFHPETYKRWVQEAIGRDCAMAGIDVKVK
ncbi:TPA: hypothetical protein MYP94_003511 [Citrobacter braakii]|nr:hypothetical protein HV345_10135 [Citrobacter sp. RHBSTW-00986]HCB1682209.1 hypothetical protein [Citrobacter braakii]